MLQLQPDFLLRPKTTMRIGGTAKQYAMLESREDAEEAMRYSIEQNLKFLPLGSGSNTIFSGEGINALVVQVKHSAVRIDHNIVTVGSGKNLPMLINELAEHGLDLSALTGIPGTVGGAIFGNAGQGPKGVWIDRYVTSVTALVDGEWQTFGKDDCDFSYRESIFKHMATRGSYPLIFEVTLEVPSDDAALIKANIQALLKKRIETQPHLKTAGSCFKAVGGTPAWQLIDEVGLRGHQVGGVQIAEKHANFLLNVGEATYQDAVAVVNEVKKKIPENLEVEMRFIEPDGSLRF